MTDHEHQRVKEIFLAATEMSVAERAAYLDSACGTDAELRSEVESLLRYAELPEDTLGTKPQAELPPAPRFETGQIFAGRYRLIKELGRGGMGQVYQAHDRVLDQPVALKFLRHPGPEQLDRLLNEVRLARQVTHPHVCRVFDFGEAENELFLTMEYVDGEDLASLLTRIGRLPEDKLIDLAIQICDALAAAHAQGILHRDLKPANIMIDGRGMARITDFGLATSRTEPPGADEEGRLLVGTPAYMAPEQMDGQSATVRSDLYALGLVLYEMATGHPAFVAKTPFEYFQLHRTSTPPAPSFEVSHLDPQLERVILRCLEKDPAERPSSVGEIAASLPGGVRLQRAMAAGETPSPDIVAAAGQSDGLKLTPAAALMGLFLVLLAGVAYFGDRAFPGRQAWASKPPAVLVARATEILRTLGHDAEPVDRAWGFITDLPQLEEPSRNLFWYRQGTSWMLPLDVGIVVEESRVSFHDPPMIEEGMARVLLDAEERLVALHVLSEQILESPEAPPAVGWSTVHALAGFSPDQLEETAPHFTPPSFADERRAWKIHGATPAQRIEAAAFAGKIVFFELRPEDEELAEDQQFFLDLFAHSLLFGELFWVVLAVLALILARHNLKQRRGDLRGARRLAVVTFALRSAAWLLSGDHIPSFTAIMERLSVALGRSLLEAVLVWVAYIGLEPLVRRLWPQPLIAWTRLLSGRLRDAMVGQHLLIGCLVGTFWALLTELDRLVVAALGLETGPEMFDVYQLDLVLSGRLMLANLLTSAVEALYMGLLALLMLVVLRRVLGRLAWGVVVFVLVNGALETLDGIHPAISWLTLGLGIGGTAAWLLVRSGLWAYIVALFSYYVLTTSPTTFTLRAWFAESGLFTCALIAALGALGLYLAAPASRPIHAPAHRASRLRDTP